MLLHLFWGLPRCVDEGLKCPNAMIILLPKISHDLIMNKVSLHEQPRLALMHHVVLVAETTRYDVPQLRYAC